MGSCVFGSVEAIDFEVKSDMKNVPQGPSFEYSEGGMFYKPRQWNMALTYVGTPGSSQLPVGITSAGHDPEFEFVQDDHHLYPTVMPLFVKERVLGQGASSEVAKVVRKSDGKAFAMKIMSRNDKWNPILFRQEWKLLSMLEHPNILRSRDCYMDKDNFYICTDLCKGGELFDKIKEMKRFAEVEAADIIETILSAIAHCHSKNIVHRDLKPENILFRTRATKDLIIIDFGDAKIIEDEGLYDDFVGTAFYLAPECIRNRKGWELKKTDIWTIGIIAYVMLTGRPPFYGRDNRAILRKILRAKINWKTRKRCKISSSAKHFVEWLLMKDPKERPTADQALQHRWLKGNAATEDLGIELLNNISEYSKATRLKKVLVRVFANEMTEQDHLALKEEFDLMDRSGNGEVDVNDLTEFILKKGGTRVGRVEAHERACAIIDHPDRSGNGVLRVEEWKNVQIAAKMRTDEDLLKKQFERIDHNNDGFITHDKLAMLFNCSITKELVGSMIKEIDHDNDGKISYKEFIQAMKDGSLKKALTTRTPFTKKMTERLLLEVKSTL